MKRPALLALLALALIGCDDERRIFADPLSLIATAGPARVRLHWQGVDGADIYRIYGADAPDVLSAKSATRGAPVEVSGTDFCEGALAEDVPHYYAVVAMKGGEPLSTSWEVEATPQGAPTYDDPLFGNQWHLLNTGQDGGTPCEDLNVLDAWARGYTGAGVQVATLDGGVVTGHPDIQGALIRDGSWDYLEEDTDPTSGDMNGVAHGTWVAGAMLARRGNAAGGSGVAPGAELAAYNYLQDADEANLLDATTRGSPLIAIRNNSWQPDSNGPGHINTAPVSWKDAVEGELAEGRGGLGTIFVFAAGNFGNASGSGLFANAPPGNANYNGHAVNHGVITVAAIGDDGVRAIYSERGANLWVSAPSMGRGFNGITTTNSPDTYTDFALGTSLSAPMVSGVVALMLEASPELGWRDVREILARSARMTDPENPGWAFNGAGLHVSHDYGFGAVDASAAVRMAEWWQPIIAPQKTAESPLREPALPIPDDDAGGVSDAAEIAASGISFIEWVEVDFTSDHADSGDLEITLKSPMGTRSILAELHTCPGCTAYEGWTFASARHLGERANGQWTLKVRDLKSGDTGTVQSWRVRVYGR